MTVEGRGQQLSYTMQVHGGSVSPSGSSEARMGPLELSWNEPTWPGLYTFVIAGCGLCREGMWVLGEVSSETEAFSWLKAVCSQASKAFTKGVGIVHHGV